MDGRISFVRSFIYKVTPFFAARSSDRVFTSDECHRKRDAVARRTYPELNRRSYGPPLSLFHPTSVDPAAPTPTLPLPSTRYGRAAAFENGKRLIRCQVARDLARINAIRDISHPADIIAPELLAGRYQMFRPSKRCFNNGNRMRIPIN